MSSTSSSSSSAAHRRPAANMPTLWTCLLVIAVLAAKGGDCLRDVKLTIQPAVVERGQSVRLLCDYDLEGGRLYAVRWYRGHREFYSYQPTVEKGRPTTKVFPIPGVISIDLAHSNATQATLTNVGFALSGNLTCEVTTDNPGMQMQQSIALMTVVALPRHAPKVWTDKERYEAGEMMLANCSAPPSTPPSQLTFSINNRTVPSADTAYHMTADREQWSKLSLRVALNQGHFQAGRLSLVCTATLPAGFARKSVPLELGVRPSEPVPERVTSSSAWLVRPHAALLLVALLAR